VRNAVLEALPCWRGHGYVIGVVNAPVGACINLLRHIWVNNDRIDRDIRQVAGLVRPYKRATVSGTGYLKHVAVCCGRIRIEAAHGSVAYGQIRSRRGRIESNAEHRTQRHNRVAPSNIHPVSLRLTAGAEFFLKEILLNANRAREGSLVAVS
jgi:hypothetical protein